MCNEQCIMLQQRFYYPFVLRIGTEGPKSRYYYRSLLKRIYKRKHHEPPHYHFLPESEFHHPVIV